MSPSQPSVEAQDYEKHADWLRSLARSLVSDPSTADDIAQETWLSALRHRPNRDEPLRPWLTRVAQNAARKLYRTEGRRKDRERLAAPVEEPLMSAAELSESADLIHTLMGEVRELSEPYRSTVLQAYLQAMTSAEIAQQTGAPEGTVRWRLSVARDELRERMDRKVGSREGWAILAAPMGFTTRLAATKAVATSATRTGVGFSWVLPMAALACLAGVFAALFNLPSISAAPSRPLSSATPLDGSVEVAAATSAEEGARQALSTPAPPASKPRAAVPRLTLDPGQAALRVRVEDAAGAPIQNVSFEWAGNPDVFTRTNSDGDAALLFRPPASGVGVDFVVHRSGYVAQRRSIRPVAGETSYLGTLQLQEAVTRRGQVMSADGKPARDVTVFAAPLRSGSLTGQAEKRARTAPPTWEGAQPKAVETQRDGSFFLTDLPREAMRVWAVSEGMWYSASDVVLPDSDEPVESVAIVLEPLPAEEAITGTVLGIDGEPAADVLVRLRPVGAGAAESPRPRPMEQTTDAQGRFCFQPRSLGSYELHGEDLLDRWKDTDWQPVDMGEASIALRFDSKLRD